MAHPKAVRFKRNANSIVGRRLIQSDAPTEHRTMASEENDQARYCGG